MSEWQLVIDYDTSPFAELVRALSGRDGTLTNRHARARCIGYRTGSLYGVFEVV
jgi:hypothetical protein